MKLVFEIGLTSTGRYESFYLIEIRCFSSLETARVMNYQQWVVSRDLAVPNRMLAFALALMAHASLDLISINMT